jgi:hypothetical protein
MEGFPKSISQIVSKESVENTTETGKKIFEFLDRTKFLNIRKSDSEFDEWIQSLGYEDFTVYLTRINGILREVPIHQRSIDGKSVEISSGYFLDETSYLPPTEINKGILMHTAFDALKSIPDNKDRALLMYYTIQAIHPYADGNGRTGRLLHELLSEEGKELNEEKLSLLLDHDKVGKTGIGSGREKFAEEVMDPNSAYYFVNREIAKDIFGDDFMKENGCIFVAAVNGVGSVPESIKEKLPPEKWTRAEKILGEGDVSHFSFRGIVLAKLIFEQPDLQKYIYESKNVLDERRKVVPEDISKKFFSIEGEKLMQNLSEENTLRLLEIHAEVKERFVRCLIDIFEHPEKHQITTKSGTIIPIKRLFSLK